MSDISTWKKAARQEGIATNQYILKATMDSPLYKFLKIKAIPQQVFLNSKHKIYTVFAPRPTPNFEKDIKKMVEFANIKVVRY